MENISAIIEPLVTYTQVQPNELPFILDKYTNIKVLSLDCFDTILWRNTAAPTDVFYSLQNKPAFKNLGFSPLLRTQYEAQARQLKLIMEKNTEVTLSDIYKSAFPLLTPEQIIELEEEELAAESEHCYAFPAIVDLIREAIAKQIKIIIVSDTYFSQVQLKKLLSTCLPIDIINNVDNIFCSSDFKKTKSNGLFKHVLERYNNPLEILHIGDNRHADYEGANHHHISALHLVQYQKIVKDKFRLNASASSIFNPNNRYSQPLLNIFRGILSNSPVTTPEQSIGFSTLGPIMYAFAKYIDSEIKELKKTRKNIKIAFLLRDAHLPFLACEALLKRPLGKEIRISRFTAFAASWRTKADIDKYLANVLLTGRYKDIAKQLLLPDEIINPLIEIVTKSSSPIIEFLDIIHREEILNIIFEKSKIARKRLFSYLKKELDLKKNDTLVFVDLGYSGTAQNQLSPIFRDELNVEIIGRYLIALDVPEWKKTRDGLLNPDWCDDRAMRSLVSHIALLEKLCTSSEKSVIDYSKDGSPIFFENQINENQDNKLYKIQSECVNFIKQAEAFFKKIKQPDSQQLKESAMTELARFIFLPTEEEVTYLESFEFDLNLGTQDILRVFDSNQGLNSLQKRGLFFSFMEKNNKHMRTNYPAELRYAGIELAMTIMTQYRFAFDISYQDQSLRRQFITVKAQKNTEEIISTFTAQFTYDGFYSLTIPMGKREFSLTIYFGEKYRWLELNSVETINADTFLSKADSLYAEDIASQLIFEDMRHIAGNLYQCENEKSTLYIPMSSRTANENSLVRIIFRPIVNNE